jgi:hypothetical protein
MAQRGLRMTLRTYNILINSCKYVTPASAALEKAEGILSIMAGSTMCFMQLFLCMDCSLFQKQ